MRCKWIWTLLLLLLLLPAAARAETYVVEGGGLVMTIDEQTLAISVAQKDTGYGFTSALDASTANESWRGFLASSLVLELTDGSAVNAKRVSALAASPIISVTRLADGVDIDLDLIDYQQRLRLCVRLEEDSLHIWVPGESIEEYGASRLCGLFLMPGFGATYLDERAGYLFIPEGAGAIVNFSDGENMGSTPYSKRIWGTNAGVDATILAQLNRLPEQVTLPVYGLAYTDQEIAYLAVVEEGAEAAEIMAYPAGVITDYNWLGARFTLREEYVTPTTRTLGLRSRETNAYVRDMGIRFYFLAGEDATYAGMARRYRQKLLAEGALTGGDTAYRPRLDFLGADSEKWLLWDNVVTMTTIADMKRILEDYIGSGLTPPLAVVSGWQKGGLNRNLGSGDLSLEPSLGSMDQLRALAAELACKGGVLLLEQDAVQANTGRLYNIQSDIVRTIGQKVAEVDTGRELYPTMYYLTPRRSAQILAALREAAQGTGGVALTTLPSLLYSYYSGNTYYTRGDTLREYGRAIEALGETCFVALQKPLTAYFSALDAYLDLPLGTTNYAYISAEVPFLPLVLSGSVPYYATYSNFSANQRYQTLKLMEYGAYPSFCITSENVQKLKSTNSSHIYSAQWDVLKDTVLSYDALMRALWEKTEGSALVDHRVLKEGVAISTYANGLQVVVNYTARPYAYKAELVQKMGYCFVEGGAGK